MPDSESACLKNEAQLLAQHAIPVAYENKKAKLQLINEWPEDLKEINQKISSGAYHDREFGDVKDIGFRDVGEGQKEDVDDGQQAIERMKRQDLLPPEINNEYINSYLTDLSKKIASHSDLRIPVKVTALNAKEVNAFALPGAFLFVQRGLLEETEDEAQLAGVIAHEIAHAAARHGHQLMQKQTIASIIYQAAQIGAVIATGGVAGIGTYYALRYGFMGLGLLLSLDLLGVSREFEIEADTLGIQYAWNSGYDPTGFVRFFDKMATTEGYVNGTSWFQTHPPFYKRMVNAEEEMMYLPDKSNLTTNTPEFERMKQELKKVTANAKEEEKGRPSLKAPEPGCPAPDKVEYQPDEPIETLFSDASRYYIRDIASAMEGFANTVPEGNWYALASFAKDMNIEVDFTKQRGKIANGFSDLRRPLWNEIDTYDAVYQMLDKMGRLRGRRILIFIGSGFDTFSEHTLDDVKEKLESVNVVVYCAGAGSGLRGSYEPYLSNSARMNLVQAQAFLNMLADKSGGQAWFPRFEAAFPDVLKGIMQMIQSQYRLVYTPQVSHDGKFHEIKVEAFTVQNDQRQDFKVRVRDGWRF